MAQIINFPMVQNPPILMADISRYQANLSDPNNIIHFDFDKYYNKGGRIIMIRSTVANAGQDYEYPYNLQQVKRKKMLLQVYGYLKLWHNIANQVAAFLDDIAQAKDTVGDLFVSAKMDIEENEGLTVNEFLNAYDGCVSKIRKGGYNGILETYTSALKFNKFMGKNKSDLAKNTELHVAHYYTGIDPHRIPVVRPYTPDNWALINNPKEPTWWQFDTYDGGFDWGSNGDNEIDLSWFTKGGGTYASFKKLYGVDLPVAVTPVPIPVGEYATILVASSSIRYDPVLEPNTLFAKAISGKKVKLVENGAVVNGYRPVVAWIYDKNIKPI